LSFNSVALSITIAHDPLAGGAKGRLRPM